MGITTDPNDPRLTRGADAADGPPAEQADAYLVLPAEERAQGFVRPVRTSYWHTVCGKVTTMGRLIAETYAREPHFYGATYCAHCRRHRPVGEDGEFHWVDPESPGRQSPTLDPKVRHVSGQSQRGALVGLVAAGMLALTGCGKLVEPYNDAPVAGQNKAPAEVLNMPDGFSNVATKCDHGNRVYVAFHGSAAYGSVAVVANDPSCAGVPR